MKSLVYIILLISFAAPLYGFEGGGKDSVATAANTALDSTNSALIVSPTVGTDRRAMPGVFDLITNLPSDWRDWSVTNVRPVFWPQMALITVSTAAMIVYDNPMWKPFDAYYKKNQTFQQTMDIFSFMGDGKFQFGIAGAFAGYGFIASDKRAIRTAAQTCEAILACGGVVQLLKHLTGRESPIVATTPTGRWQFFPNQIEYAKHVPHYDAFPSGHLATALATLTVVANNYPEVKWLKPAGYVVCAGIATGLVAQSIHWWSDFPLSIALGIGFGNLISPNPDGDVSVIEKTKEKDMGENRSPFSRLLDRAMIMPTTTPDGGAAIAMTLKF
jgi:membrane-associated phospholipid phosphatase